MKKSRFTETKIISILKQQEDGKKVLDICREHGIAEQTFYNWKARYGGMSIPELQRVKDLEDENARLKRIVANLTLENDAIKHVLEKSSGACRKTGSDKDHGGGKVSKSASGLLNS